ncbi:uncharacterized protein [Epargyreus clarus]|uniref:uncharacterized protein n=1 Tax=Epargyreus clarus TaxID=520877 RepID=UPI003C3037B4
MDDCRMPYLDADILCVVASWMFVLMRMIRQPSPHTLHKEEEERKFHALQSMTEKWKERLAEPTAGLRTVEAVRPVLEDWMDRRHGSLTFRLVQVLSGQGCFGKYLCRIAGREPTTRCHHCSCDVDTAQHTLEECPAWARQRRVLIAAVGPDLSLSAVVKAMVESDRSWKVVKSFCGEGEREILRPPYPQPEIRA